MGEPMVNNFCCCCSLSAGNTFYAYFQFFVSLISIGIGIMKFMTSKADQKIHGFDFGVPDELKLLFADGPLFNLLRIIFGFVYAAILLIFVEGIKKQKASKMVAYLFFKTINLFGYFILILASPTHMMLIIMLILAIEIYLFICAYSLYLSVVKPDNGFESDIEH